MCDINSIIKPYKNLTDEEQNKDNSLDLAQIINKYGSDKDINGYTPLYHTLFNKIRNQPIDLLEIGIGTMIPNVSSSMVGYGLGDYKPGASLRAWRDYFKRGNIVGFDIQPDTQFSEERIRTFICNSTDNTSVNNIMPELNTKFDIIIDDGSHYFQHQLDTLNNMFPYLKDNGIYVIEDIGEYSPLSTNPLLIQKIVNDNPFFFSGVKNNLCIIYKSPLKSNYLETNNW